jgi:serine phosphatase RsbU (regulator of sigma subunit)
MDLTWSIDDVARTSDEAVVRRRFADRNRLWLTLLLMLFAFVSFLKVVTNHRSNLPMDILLGTGSFAVAAFGLFFIRYAREQLRGTTLTWRVGGWLRAHFSAVTLGYLAMQFAVLLAFTRRSENWLAWLFIFPCLMLGFRMLVTELVLLHGYLTAASVLMTLIGDARTELLPVYIGIAVSNGAALTIELYLSRRMRRDVIGEWTSRRAQAREQVRMRDELRYARELQLSMLPESAPKLEWADISSASIPASEVGGDYYDYFVERSADTERVALVCVDVAGHGMSSGLVLAALRSGFTLLRDSLHDPAFVLRRLHTLVAETSRRRMLATVSVALLDRSARRVTIASAGNPPVILRRTGIDGAPPTVETIDLFAPPLGVRLPVDIPQREVDVERGDVLVLHSDGIYETRNARDEVYGLERISRMVAEQGGGTAEWLRDSLLADLAAFRGSVEQGDDVTVVVCRLT